MHGSDFYIQISDYKGGSEKKTTVLDFSQIQYHGGEVETLGGSMFLKPQGAFRSPGDLVQRLLRIQWVCAGPDTLHSKSISR